MLPPCITLTSMGLRTEHFYSLIITDETRVTINRDTHTVAFEYLLCRPINNFQRFTYQKLCNVNFWYYIPGDAGASSDKKTINSNCVHM